MQKRITHYLIGVGYNIPNSTIPILYSFCVELARYPSMNEIVEYILANVKDSSNVCVLGISPQTENENNLYLEN